MPLQEIIWDDFKIIATIPHSQNNILLKYIFYKKKEDEYVVFSTDVCQFIIIANGDSELERGESQLY